MSAIFFLVIGTAIGSLATWIYLMNKYAGRPVDWRLMITTFVVTLHVLFFLQFTL